MDRLRDLAGALADTGAEIGTIAADASDPDGLGARMGELYLGDGAPGVIVYNAVVGAPDRLLSSSVAHLQAAYSVDVISAIVVAQAAAPAMRAAGSGTILVTGGGFADHPIPALATVSLGKAALRSAATMLGADLEPDGVRVATLTIAGTIVAGTSFDPERIARTLLGGCPPGRSMAGRIPIYRLEDRTTRQRPHFARSCVYLREIIRVLVGRGRFSAGAASAQPKRRSAPRSRS